MTIVKYEKGMAVQVLKMRDDKPSWVSGFVFVRPVDDNCIRVQQISEGPGHTHITTWTHDRIRPDTTPVRFG